MRLHSIKTHKNFVQLTQWSYGHQYRSVCDFAAPLFEKVIEFLIFKNNYLIFNHSEMHLSCWLTSFCRLSYAFFNRFVSSAKRWFRWSQWTISFFIITSCLVAGDLFERVNKWANPINRSIDQQTNQATNTIRVERRNYFYYFSRAESIANVAHVVKFKGTNQRTNQPTYQPIISRMPNVSHGGFSSWLNGTTTANIVVAISFYEWMYQSIDQTIDRSFRESLAKCH